MIKPETANSTMAEWKTWITATFIWMYIDTQDAWAVFIIVLHFSKYGNMKLGKPNEKPEFNDATYFTMLFAAGVFSKQFSPFEEPKTIESVFQSESGVLPCFEIKFKFLERHKKPLSLARTRKRENPAQKMASKSATKQDEEGTTEEVPGSIVIYIEEEIN
ncbi:hypothetical protein pdam_00016947 [Pocillopora damicornis]|uniref:Uncharacterized protein n=1 Tax=Pocillopora damicornis TaxID=46731 RepID=A0A3M6TQW4_POCDA|nr:hypothetical protein pdam_00016947 [Pocillopora damicornis]